MRKPDPRHKLQADSIREFRVALEDEAARLHARGHRAYPGGKDWLPPAVLLNWIVAGFLELEPEDRERFAAGAGRAAFDRRLAADHPRYYDVEAGGAAEGAGAGAPASTQAGGEGTGSGHSPEHDAVRPEAVKSRGRRRA